MLFNLLSVKVLKSYPANIFFCPENSVLFYIQEHFRLMEANTINPDQTASFGAV